MPASKTIKNSDTLRAYRAQVTKQLAPWRRSAQAVDDAVVARRMAPKLDHRDEIVAQLAKSDGETSEKLAKRPDAYLAALFLGTCRRIERSIDERIDEEVTREARMDGVPVALARENAAKQAMLDRVADRYRVFEDHADDEAAGLTAEERAKRDMYKRYDHAPRAPKAKVFK